MKLEDVPIAAAEGGVLAHSRRLGPGTVLKKGRTLTAADCGALAASGVERVVVARLEGGDLDEDEASHRIAEATAGQHVRVDRAATGRTNLFAVARGLLVVSRAHLDEINLIDEAITVATTVPFAAVEAGAMVATVKIIPFAVPGSLVEHAVSRARARRFRIDVAPFTPKRAGLVLTILPGIRDEQLARAAQNQRTRLARLGGELARELRVSHDPPSVARAVAGLIEEGLDLVLVLGASAIVDRRDVIPVAIEAAGGVVDHLGMPVDPGNLLLLGHKGPVPIVGVPGCARSLKRSGFDWVLERVVAGVSVQREDIMRLGAGGLLVEEAHTSSPEADAQGTGAS